jgi:hypothetical protein
MESKPQVEDFSLVLGGPLYQLFRRSHLSGEGLELLRRRILVLTGLAWLPLLALTILEGHAWGGGIEVPFLADFDVNVRFLVALPLLVVAEMVVHQRMQPVLAQFRLRRLIAEASRARFDAAVDSALRLRNSVLAEVVLLLIVYGGGVLFLWRKNAALDVSSWYGVPVGGALHPSGAGWWLGLVALPIFQFLLLRWYFRLLIWARFLWQVSRMELRLIPTHPDRACGLGFLGTLTYAFSPLLVAQGAMLAGVLANRIVYMGESLPAHKVEIIGYVAMMVLFVVGPSMMFGPALARAKRTGQREYGLLAARYVREFDDKWLRGGAPADEALVGSADIQSLADLGNSYEAIKQMRLVPFTMQTVLQLGLETLAPISPLLLTMFPLSDLLERLLRVLF